MTIRLDDIARQAGVSTATVSRVLNGRVGVSEQARRSVLTAIDVLGYERPVTLRGRATGLIGVLVPELRNPIFPALAEAIEIALAHHGYNHLLCTRNPGISGERAYIDMLSSHGVAGIIFVSGIHSDTTAETEQYQELITSGMPLAFINGYAAELDAIFVSTDDSVAMELGVRHLADLGHTNIGLAVGPERYLPSAGKIDGFRAAHARHLPNEPHAVHVGGYTVESGRAAAKTLIGQGATGIVCASDFIALGAVRGARELGLHVPDDFSIIGYDGSLLTAYTDPPLTTIRQPVDTIAQTTVEALIDDIAGRPVPHTEITIQPELVVRDSTGRYRPRLARAGQRAP
ncbi:MAG: LacI family DNA-binding transcriptional regulator [Micropruina sp.]|nr:LacI family DNA-binding transcriptional regulator [Micropruina sp.]